MTGFFFGRNGMSPATPKLSIICINRNHADFLEDNILSVLSQKFDDFEYIVADGGSTDESLKIIRKYPFIKLIGPDTSIYEGLKNGFAVAKGQYVMVTTSTDGLLSRQWLQMASSVLDEDQDVSLVWGAYAAMDETGGIGNVIPSNFDSIPQKSEWCTYWILHNDISSAYLPELNFCIRSEVLRACATLNPDFPEIPEFNIMARVNFEFIRRGYLPRYLPILASFGRCHESQQTHTKVVQDSVSGYAAALQRFRNELLSSNQPLLLRNGSGHPIMSIHFSAE
jgi:glycosyltransferase involved in cell wall biosynthesis